MTKVTVVTLEKVVPARNEDKFYRLFFSASGTSYSQWGSQRNGRSGGQSKQWASAQDAIAKLAEKQGEGYQEVETVEVEVPSWYSLQGLDETDKANIKIAIAQLENLANTAPPSSVSRTPAPSTPGVPAAAPDRIAEISTKILQAITIAGGDQVKGAVARIDILDQLDPLMAEFRKLQSYASTLDMVLGRS